MRSTRRIIAVSSAPPMKPATSPYAVPTITEITVASSAIVSEMRVP